MRQVVVYGLSLLVTGLFAASPQARPPDPESLARVAAAAQRVVDAAGTVESDLSLLETAANENPESVPVYAGRVQGHLHGLAAAQRLLVSEMAANGGAIDPNALIQFVLREAYEQTVEDLRFYASQLKVINQEHKVDRELLDRLSRDVLHVQSLAQFVLSKISCPRCNT